MAAKHRLQTAAVSRGRIKVTSFERKRKDVRSAPPMSRVKILVIALVTVFASPATADYSGQTCDSIYKRRDSPWSDDCSKWKEWD
ncbi:hypothetical protein M427DRAFT_257067 [Gonapodya prolifera JEL478]|uniref:Uncharacterized protein n=1 Tax=Gonapodya prolifera (strain JEL478) TaxID=1344416 RepID=A0A138ZY81_GONPJ|nr:hypothetical protein M427DRAFT_257067 [Gonapodya prolifera JEL478]|eukprot:KXS09083.1 hypothetical protein M427DRAFT_257067 [Gonapodya prolifera JEL478]